jgi:CTP synthase (UTP-ammonia lyase)
VLIGVVGDYKPENPTHQTLNASLAHVDAEAEWVPTDAIPSPEVLFGRYVGLWIAPASPYKSMEGALGAIRLARERGVPLVATWGGFQHVLVEYARNVVGVKTADHAETRPDGDILVVTPLSCSLVGQAQRVIALPDSRAAALYGSTEDVVEDFYCNYGLNPDYRPLLEQAGLRITGVDDDGEVRIVELPDHPFYLATLFCFQTRSRPERPHPLLAGFVEAARATSR